MFNFSKKNHIGYIVIDLKSSKVNILNRDFSDEFLALWDRIEKEENLRGIIISSAKKDNFIAGADLKMFQDCQSKTEAAKISAIAQKCFNTIANCHLPVIAAVHGSCLGGGLELAIACDYRIASDSSSTEFAASEVKLGLIPGGGGTVRLPKLIGLKQSLDMMLSGNTLTAKQASAYGLVNEVVPESILLDVARDYIKKGKAKNSTPTKSNWKDRLKNTVLNENKLGQNLVIKMARKKMLEKTNGLYPAPKKLLDLMENRINSTQEKLFLEEQNAFAELVMSWQSYNLRFLFLADKELAKENKAKMHNLNADVDRVGIIGAGLMGSGICYVTASNTNKFVRIKDINEEKLAQALNNIHRLFKKGVKHQKIKAFTAKQRFQNIGPTTDFSGFNHIDLVIEAVNEDIDLKSKIFKDLEKHSKNDLVIASNTSAIPITELAENYHKPQYVIGMHYFSPVYKMPLLEIIKTKKVNKTVLAKAINLGLQQGKKIIIVEDGCGFYTTRVLTAFLVESFHALQEGYSIETIDKSIKELGFPMGPFELMDEIGLNVSIKIAQFMAERMGEEFKINLNLDELDEVDSFYQYKKGEISSVNKSALSKLKIDSKTNGEVNKDIQQRCLGRFQREAVKCLEEGILGSSRDGDLGAVYGLGFPPFEGGPFRLIDRMGVNKMNELLTSLEEQHGSRFSKPGLLKTMAENNKTFY